MPQKRPLKSSPWGAVQDEFVIAPGITHVTTASHGGFKVDRELNEKIPESMREKGGWYEEDVDWAIIPVIYPQFFSEKEREHAIETLKNWRPNLYERFFEERLAPGESLVRDEELFLKEHRNDYIAISAFGSWHKGVPGGFVGVLAKRGGRKPGKYTSEDLAWFLVPETEYEERGPFGFVVDEDRYPQIDPLR